MYTHYFPHTKVEQEVWDKILADCITLRNTFRYPIAGWDGHGFAEFTGENISFNGVGADAHESFHLYRDGSNRFEFCKTSKKPYDLLVCTCLLVYCFHSRQTVKLSSDGDLDDWQDSFEFITRVLGEVYVVKFVLEGGLDG